MSGGKQPSLGYLRQAGPSSTKRLFGDTAAADPATPANKQVKMAPLFQKNVPVDHTISRLGVTSGAKGFVHFVFEHPKPSPKIAAFDIDGTLIVTRSGHKFPKDKDDFKFWSQPEVRDKIRAAYDDGFAIVLISNQAGSPGQQKAFEGKLPLLSRQLKVPLRAFAALGRDVYRKPATAIWDEFVANFNGGIPIDYTKSYYVGDAAGRAGDHADTDRKFALNCGLPFLTPEEYFKGAPASQDYVLGGFDPKAYDHSQPLFTPTSRPLLPHRTSEFDDDPIEVVIFVGSPGAGKSSFFQKHFAPRGYVHINQDTLKTRDACVKALRQTLSSTPPRPCVIDNTSPARSTREVYLSILRTEFPNVKARCFVFTASREVCMHNSVYRACYEPIDPVNGKKREVLPDIAFSAFASNFERPTLEEGFEEIKHIQFKFEGTPEQRTKWERWLIDVYKVPKLPTVPKSLKSTNPFNLASNRGKKQ
ncbi:polynucleotide 3'-phosphatase [Sporobolomyces koalae]|uniref:polynucleotide 3'-phosphatase n=1 Tax=Sporobolomyces koalae TaxID=500713 RepID=UPI00317EE75B